MKSDALDAKLSNIKQNLKFEVTEIKKNFETFKAKNHEEVVQFKETIKSVEE